MPGRDDDEGFNFDDMEEDAPAATAAADTTVSHSTWP